jgi:hypothetical protein
MERKCSRCGKIKDETLFQKSFGGARKNYCYACKGRYQVAKARLEIYAALGSKCSCCGESHPQFLTLDHVKNDGGQRRKLPTERTWLQTVGIAKKEGWPKDRYQVLCYNCNSAKGHWGECPHKSSETRKQYLNELRKIISIKGTKFRNFQEKTNDPNFKEQRPWKSGEMLGNDYAVQKLSGEQVSEVRKLREEGWIHRDIARKFGVSRSLIGMILQGKRR